MKILAIISLILFLSSCIFVPKEVRDSDNHRCKLETKKRALELKTATNGYFGHCSNTDCLAVFGVVTASSLVISGSIVLVGNTVHWLEKQGKCDDSVVKKVLANYLQPLLQEGGMVIEEYE